MIGKHNELMCEQGVSVAVIPDMIPALTIEETVKKVLHFQDLFHQISSKNKFPT